MNSHLNLTDNIFKRKVLWDWLFVFRSILHCCLLSFAALTPQPHFLGFLLTGSGQAFLKYADKEWGEESLIIWGNLTWKWPLLWFTSWKIYWSFTSWLLYHSDTQPSFVVEYFLNFWHYKMSQPHLIFSLPWPWVSHCPKESWLILLESGSGCWVCSSPLRFHYFQSLLIDRIGVVFMYANSHVDTYIGCLYFYPSVYILSKI